MSAIRVAVVGASGYAGEELLRLLLRHRQCKVTAVTSRKYAGQPVSEVFPRFLGSGLEFSAPDARELAANCDVAFLALPHGLATEFAIPLLNAGVKVIDISADFSSCYHNACAAATDCRSAIATGFARRI